MRHTHYIRHLFLEKLQIRRELNVSTNFKDKHYDRCCTALICSAHYMPSVLKSSGFITATLPIHNAVSHTFYFLSHATYNAEAPVEYWSCPNGKTVKKPQAELFLLDLSEQIFSEMDDDGLPLKCAAE